MGYLVIKNGSNKKSYLCTNTCNKPRIKVSNSYIPLTNNIKNGMRCKITNKNIAEYSSYTYTGNQGTITTGTTYQTRSSASNTLYGTQTSMSFSPYTFIESNVSITLYTGYKSDNKSIFTVQCLENYNGYTVTVENNNTGYMSNLKWKFITYSPDGVYSHVLLSHTITFKTGARDQPLYSAEYTGNAWQTSSSRTGDAMFTHGICISIIHTAWPVDTTVTTGTTYQTRSSTYGTLYGTKTTNKTLTSSSWG